ncbi:hypothetical protein NMY22_g1437 [Coprinellus aureogranulatus]|nr:hypothetical protein NMY22_g1437 [Coprinellus aureogranulatus]
MGPCRWECLVQDKAVPFHDIDRAVALPETADRMELRIHWMALSLVPGGRYLAMVSNREGVLMLELWDLGVPGRRPRPANSDAIPLAGTPVYPRSDTYKLHVLPDGESLKVAMFHKAEDSINVCRIFSITPSHESPAFLELATLQLLPSHLPTPMEQYFHIDRVLFRQYRFYTLWNFRSSLFTEWVVPGEDDNVTLTADYVVLLRQTRVSIWRISDLERHSRPVPERPLNPLPAALRMLLPKYDIAYPGDPLNDASRLRGQFIPYPGGCFPPLLAFELLDQVSKSSLLFRRYTLSVDEECQVATVQHSSGGYFPEDSSTLFYFMIADTPYLELRGGTRNPRDEEGKPTRRTYLYNAKTSHNIDINAQGGDIVVTALEPGTTLRASCVASGRFIYTKQDPATGDSRTIVLDYL